MQKLIDTIIFEKILKLMVLSPIQKVNPFKQRIILKLKEAGGLRA